jgi:putative ABC transport system permease protein
MIKRFKFLLRTVKRNKQSFIINIAGLSIGMGATVLLVIFIVYEWSYDKHFAKKERIYRLETIWKEKGEESVMPICLRTAFTELQDQVPGIEHATQIFYGELDDLIYNKSKYIQNKLLYVDSTFFKVFQLRVLEGSTDKSLDNPENIILSKKLADKIFGKRSAIGKLLVMQDKSYTVSAVVDDLPPNTHFQFDFLLPMSAIGQAQLQGLQGLEFFTYYLIQKNANTSQVLNSICEVYTKQLKNKFSYYNAEFSASVIPLEKIHLYSKASDNFGNNNDFSSQGSINTLFVVGIIAILILFLAITNFINLFVLEGEQRAKEIGVRKVSGAGQSTLIRQFFAETSTVVFISFLLAFLLAELILPFFGRIMQRDLTISLIKSPSFILAALVLFVITLVLTSSYPAFILSRLNPVSILKSQLSDKGRKRVVMNLASGFQMIITLCLLTVLFGINRQIHFLKDHNPGFNPKGVTHIFNLSDPIKEHFSAIRQKLLEIPEITHVAASGHTIGDGYSGQRISLLGKSEDNVKSINEYRIQPGICALLGLQLVEGRYFQPDKPLDREGVILNEAAVKELGVRSIAGRKVVIFNRPMEIIGVVKDFNYESAAEQITPLVLTCYSGNIKKIVVRIADKANTSIVMKKVEQVLKSFDSNYILLSKNLSDTYENYYADEKRLGQLTSIGAVLAVIIVMTGIYFLISYSVTRRTKEIGIRKVLGGSIVKMMLLVYSNSLKWIALASVIAVPLSYAYLHFWLQDFVVREKLRWWIFLMGLFIVLFLECIITVVKTWRAAKRNPVEALKYE